MSDRKYFLIYYYIIYSCITQRCTLSFMFVKMLNTSHAGILCMHSCQMYVSRIKVPYVAIRMSCLLYVRVSSYCQNPSEYSYNLLSCERHRFPFVNRNTINLCSSNCILITYYLTKLRIEVAKETRKTRILVPNLHSGKVDNSCH